MTRIKLCKPLLYSNCAFLALAFSTAAMAQESNTEVPPSNPGEQVDQQRRLESVTVTARQRDEQLIDVPVAITALSEERLDQYAATDLIKIGQLAPNVVIYPNGNGSGAGISIRGVGSTASDSGVEQTVTIQIDGVPVGRGRIISSSMFDLAGVEILKGPQALFFGKNSPGGVISLRSTNPDDKFEGYARTGYEFEAQNTYAEGAVSIPIKEDLAARVAVRASKGRGFIENTAGPIASPFQPGAILPGRNDDRGEIKDIAARLTLVYEPNSVFSANFKHLYTRNQQTNVVPDETHCAPGVDTGITSVGVQDPFSDCKLDWRASLGTVPAAVAAGWPMSHGGTPFSDVESNLSGLTLNYDAGSVRLTSVTSYYDLASENWASLAGSVTAFFAGTNNEWNTTFTQELRASSNFDSPFNFTAGLFYEDGDRQFQNQSLLGYLTADSAGRTYTDQVDFQTNSNAYSAFGQLRWDVTPDLELAGGARWTREEKDGTLGNSFVNANTTFPLLPAGQFINNSISDEAVTPEATITWKGLDGLTLYAAYKTGYKSPGITNTIVITPVYTKDNTVFDAEDSEGFELGAKFSLFSGSLNGDVTAFSYQFKDLQVVSFDSSSITYLVQNAAEAETKGIEVQGAWLATDKLTIDGNLSYLDATYVDFPSTGCYVGQVQGCSAQNDQDISGRQLVGAPEWSGRLGAAYDQPLSSGFDLNLSADINYKSEYNSSLTYSPYTHQDAFSVVNAAIRLKRDGENWEFAVIGKNLFNEAYLISSSDIPGSSLGDIRSIVGDPRTVALQLTYEF